MKYAIAGILAAGALLGSALMPSVARADWKADANHKTDKAERKVKSTGRKAKVKTNRGAKKAGDATGRTLERGGNAVKDSGDKLRDKSR